MNYHRQVGHLVIISFSQAYLLQIPFQDALQVEKYTEHNDRD